MVALLAIGIDYIGTSSRLQNCQKDARRWYNTIPSKSRSLLLERDASRSGIIKAIEALLKYPASEYVITYSGHGTDIPDTGNENDTAIVPADMNLISDNELSALFAKTTTPILFIADCCHSGTIHRGETARTIPYNHEMVRPVPVPRYDNPHVTLLSGCKDSEVSWDGLDGVPLGNLTNHASKAFKTGITMKEWFDSFMPIPKQTPQLHGQVNRLTPGSVQQEVSTTIFPTIYMKKDGILYESTGWRPSPGGS